MKKTSTWLRTITFICVFVLALNCSAFASSQINIVSPEEAANLALFYYCSNQPSDDLVSIDNYVATPLYDGDGNITYYAIDFFFENEPKGYVLIGQNLTYLQCPELSLEGNSSYYLDALAGNETIYFNPINVFTQAENEEIYEDLSGQEIALSNVDGELIEGSTYENRILLNTIDTVEYAEDSRISFSEHPTAYLASLGYYDIVSTSRYGTCESELQQAGAFNKMFDVPSGGILVGGVLLKNPNHCGITVASNMLLYWRHKLNLTTLPSTYSAMFSSVLTTAVSNGYFVNERGTSKQPYYLNFHLINDLICDVLEKHQALSNGFLTETEGYDWSYLTTNINEKRPIIAGFWHDKPMQTEPQFIYDSHFVMIFGYNVITANKNQYSYEYKFIKLYDGWVDGNSSTRGRYVCWQALTSSELNVSIENGIVIDHSIRTLMLSPSLYVSGTL